MFVNQITLQMLESAKQKTFKFNDQFARNPNFAGGDSRLIGFVGEEVLLIDYPTSALARLRVYDFDINARCAGTIYQLADRLINVKSNAYHYAFMPPSHYRVAVMSKELPEGSIVSEVDFVFVKVDLKRMKAYTVGWLPLTQFLRRAERVFPPDLNLKFPAHVVLIAELNPIETLHAPRVL
jgi:hypothetical protein